MARKIIECDSTTAEPLVLASAQTYSELSSGYDDDFNPETWHCGSIGVCFDNDELNVYVLANNKAWKPVLNEG